MQFHAPHSSSTSTSDPTAETSPPPADLLRRLDDLKEHLLEADEFSVPFEYFDTHVACSPALFDFSDPKTNAHLLATIETCAQRAIPRFQLRQRMMFEVADTGFWHGMGLGRREQLFFYYFDCVRMGLIGLSDPFDPRGVMHYLRFSAFKAEAPAMPGPRTRGKA